MENVRKYKIPIWRTSIIYGLIAGVCYILYFLIMRAAGLMDRFELRHFNFVLTIIFTVAALAKINGKTRNQLEFLTGLAVCMVVAGFSFGLFGAFMFVYLRWLDPGFMEYLVANAPFGDYLTPISTAGWVVHEGFGAMIIISLILVETFKLIQMLTGSPKPQYK
jgi:hypothetical protein